MGTQWVGTRGCRLSLAEVGVLSPSWQPPGLGQGVWGRLPRGTKQGWEWGCSPTVVRRVLCPRAAADAFHGGTNVALAGMGLHTQGFGLCREWESSGAKSQPSLPMFGLAAVAGC